MKNLVSFLAFISIIAVFFVLMASGGFDAVQIDSTSEETFSRSLQEMERQLTEEDRIELRSALYVIQAHHVLSYDGLYSEDKLEELRWESKRKLHGMTYHDIIIAAKRIERKQ